MLYVAVKRLNDTYILRRQYSTMHVTNCLQRPTQYHCLPFYMNRHMVHIMHVTCPKSAAMTSMARIGTHDLIIGPMPRPPVCNTVWQVCISGTSLKRVHSCTKLFCKPKECNKFGIMSQDYGIHINSSKYNFCHLV